MAEDYIVLPISVLQAEAARVLNALGEGRTVYVAKQGDIIAAFRPVNASSPCRDSGSGAGMAEIDPLSTGQEAMLAAINNAVDGLPSLVMENHDVCGVLTAAVTPTPSAIPDLDVAGARSEAVLQYLAEHPGAALDDIVAFTTKWESPLISKP